VQYSKLPDTQTSSPTPDLETAPLPNPQTFITRCNEITLTNLGGSDLFPAGFIDETLRTLSLLLPPNDKKTLIWFRREQRRNLNDEFVDGTAIGCRPLSMKERQIDNFEFWHDRLVMLKQAFDESDPKTVRQ
jgi:hypothetical protein